MNQILVTENEKNKQKKQGSKAPLEIKSIVRFFAIVILIFGICLIGEGSYAIYQNAEDSKPANMPTVTISRVNDKAILRVEHSVEISKIIYSWGDGEETVLPEGTFVVQEEILLPNQNSVLNITVEDMNGKKVKYQKEYYLEGTDITKPIITIDVPDGSHIMTITATDETEIAYLSYQWEGEEEVIINATAEGQTEIKQEIELTPGTKKINIIAKDIYGNIEQIEKTVTATISEPKVQILQDANNANEFILEISDESGLKEIQVNINGQQYANTVNGETYLKLGPIQLNEGNNTISIEVTNVSGYTKKFKTELQYTP